MLMNQKRWDKDRNKAGGSFCWNAWQRRRCSYSEVQLWVKTKCPTFNRASLVTPAGRHFLCADSSNLDYSWLSKHVKHDLSVEARGCEAQTNTVFCTGRFPSLSINNHVVLMVSPSVEREGGETMLIPRGWRVCGFTPMLSPLPSYVFSNWPKNSVGHLMFTAQTNKQTKLVTSSSWLARWCCGAALGALTRSSLAGSEVILYLGCCAT